MNLISSFLHTADLRAGQTAVVAGDGGSISFADLARDSAQLAAAWQKSGISKGDRVLLAMPVGIPLYAAIAGLWRLGATIVFPEPAMGLAGLRHAIEMTRPDAFLSAGAYRWLPLIVPGLWRVRHKLSPQMGGGKADPLVDVEPDHPALISFTSGSTGRPKGIVRSHGFLAAQNACVAELLEPDREDETDLVAFPVFVIANLGQGITSVLPNWKLTRHDRARAEDIAALVRTQSITRALIPPSICEVMAQSSIGFDLSTVFTGGGPVFPDLIKRLTAKMPDTVLAAVYGSTEAEPICHLHAHEISERQWQDMANGKGLLAGRPIEQISLKIADDEIVVTGEHVNKGYLDGRGDEENKLRMDGDVWHRTGDAGRVDEAGNLWLRGRWSARAGALFPFEAEVAARSWPGVEQAALVPGSTPPTIAIQGDEAEAAGWQEKASALGDLEVKAVREIPLDRRHRSKVDYARLQSVLDK